MKSKVITFFAVFAILLLAFGIPASPASAQGGCEFAVIIDEVGVLDQRTICDAAKPLAEHGLDVFIYLSNQTFNNEDVWYDHLWSIEDDNNFIKNDDWIPRFLGLEATYDLSEVTITAGSVVNSTSINTKKILASIKQAITDGIDGEGGKNPTQGFVDALNIAYQSAYAPKPTATTGPSPTPKPTATPKPPMFTETERANMAAGFWNFVKIFLGLAVLGVVGYFVMQAVKKAQHITSLQDHAHMLEKTLLKLQYVASEMLGTRTALSLMKMWKVVGGDNQPTQNKIVTDYIQDSLTVLDNINGIIGEIPDTIPSEESELLALISKLERAYLYFAGNSEEVETLTEDDIRRLMDPVLSFDTGELDSSFVQSSTALFREMKGSAVTIKLLVEGGSDADPMGILGRIVEIKKLLGKLQDAKASVENDMDELDGHRKEAGGSNNPFV